MLVKTPSRNRNPCSPKLASAKSPTISLRSFTAVATVPAAPGKSIGMMAPEARSAKATYRADICTSFRIRNPPLAFRDHMPLQASSVRKIAFDCRETQGELSVRLRGCCVPIWLETALRRGESGGFSAWSTPKSLRSCGVTGNSTNCASGRHSAYTSRSTPLYPGVPSARRFRYARCLHA